MRKLSAIFLLLFMIVLLFAVSCKDGGTLRSRELLYTEGNWVSIDDFNRMRTLSSEITNGRVIVKMEVDFSDLKLKDFSAIQFSKAVSGSPDYGLDFEASRILNAPGFFDKPYKGEVLLVFEGDDINPPADGASEMYLMTVGTRSFSFMYGEKKKD